MENTQKEDNGLKIKKQKLLRYILDFEIKKIEVEFSLN
jgi:hypothetical protein